MAVEGLVGEAWVLIRPYTGDFGPTLKKEVGAATAAVDAETAAAGGMIGPKTVAATEKQAATAADKAATSFNKRMDTVGRHAVTGATGALLGGLALAETGKEVVKAATDFETAEASIASQTGQTVNQVKALGGAFLDSARNGEVMFKASDLAKSYAGVAGQLKLTTGHVLNNTQALKFMKAAENDAEASGGTLDSNTAALSSTMQAFHLKIKNVNHESDLLYNVSRALNTPIDQVATAVNRLHTRLGIAAPTLNDTGGLMVSIGKAGITGSRGVMIVNTAMQTLLGSAKASGPAHKASAAQVMSARISEQTATDNVTKALKTYGAQSEQYVIAVERQKLAQQHLADIQKPVAAKLTATQQSVKDLGLSVFDQKGKFVGMASLIEQLGPKLDKMSDKQRTLTLQTLFGKSASQVMGTVIAQGIGGWDNASAAVERHGTAERGAQLQAHTLKGETRILGSQMDALATEVGQKVIPALTAATGWLIKHKGATEALAAVIGGILVLAVGRYVGKLVWSTGKTAVEIGKQIAQWTGLSKKVEATKADAAATGKSLGGAGAKAGAELETGATTAATEMETGATTASGTMAAGGATAEGELAAGGAAAEAELSAGGATAEAEIAAGGATAEGELAAGGAAAGAEGAAGGMAGAAGAEGALGAGAAGAGSLAAGLGVAAAGQAAFWGTTEILKHTAAGGAVRSGARKVATLFGAHYAHPTTSTTSSTDDTVKALDAYAKSHGETVQQLEASSSQMADFRRQQGITVPTPKGWHAPMAAPTTANEKDLKRLIAEQNGGTKQVASHTNETNAHLKHQTQVLERIDRHLARRTHGHVTQLSRFLAEEFRQ